MIPNTNAYVALRDQSQEFLDFVVLSCTAIPGLVHQIQTAGQLSAPADHFKGVPNLTQLQQYAGAYQASLSRMIVITLWSYFEAYVMGVLREIIDFHGGDGPFLATAEKRAQSFLKSTTPVVLESKRKLQEPAKPKNKGRYQKHSAVLLKHGFRFPSELLAPYGVKNMIKKSKPRGAKAYEIPELLRDALCFPLSQTEQARLDHIRNFRNGLAHGTPAPVPLKDALSVGKDLRAMAAKIDKHITEHFFVLEAYA